VKPIIVSSIRGDGIGMKFKEIVSIYPDQLYHGYKESLSVFYRKYFGKEGNILLWRNVPLTMFAVDYVRRGRAVLDKLDEHPFIQYEYERYADSKEVQNDTHKFAAAERIIKMVDSIRKHGYAKGKYGKPRYMIRVAQGFCAPYGSDPNAFTLLSRKHRAAACVALGMDHFSVRVHA
jgi:hypothetical protein